MSHANVSDSSTRSPLFLLAIGALGIVFGDIGTSPLYTFNAVLQLAGDNTQPETVLGALSLLFWTLILITSVKYVMLAMRIDNNGEGGILALMSLLTGKEKQHRLIIFAGLFGAALVYGDGAVTPAISVLSALEGMELIIPGVSPYILPITIAILIAIFSVQHFGTARISKWFAPVMVVWFMSMAMLGVHGIILNPEVLKALNPWYSVHFLFSNGYASFVILGGVFLCVTGAEALYADMGHFGKRPVWLAWFGLVFPCLLLNYAGQAAFILANPHLTDNIFYRLAPSVLRGPLIVLATLATIIASQAIITGAFSMTRQAIQLGWLPRMRITQTAEDNYGQIYIGAVNWALMVATLALVLFFRSSAALASAYGIAVSLTMLMTTCLLFIAMRQIWNWGRVPCALVAGAFLVIDSSFVAANMAKLMNGGYIPLLLAAALCMLMIIWRRGTTQIVRNINEHPVSMTAFLQTIRESAVSRVPGTGIFLSKQPDITPAVMSWHVARNHALQKNLIVTTIEIAMVPRIASEERVRVQQVDESVYRVMARYGFMESPNIPQLLQGIELFAQVDFTDATWYIGHESVVGAPHNGLPAWQRKLFVFMKRNSSHVTDYYSLPHNQVIEIGRQVSI
ncbi:potassium transporter Kup [[Enterobacter] lignolyticus]|uniref:Low affinity potassium transport system protein Kup n=1 Tax=Enterobacter lignolyticus (strain SCF1) TaxID=701347 RepID=E3G236_ENTLS|nr:potassium transporter Kup [[Enterobacter] lignolyticus]ADO49170.1 potassium transporter [[Enterobacter] lignolyticus SCF1]